MNSRTIRFALNGHRAASATGAAYLFQLSDLGLASNLSVVPSGAWLQLDTCGALATGPVLVVAVDLSGQPLFLPVASGTVNGSGGFGFGATVPSGLAGLTVALQSFAAIQSGKAGTSRTLLLTFL